MRKITKKSPGVSRKLMEEARRAMRPAVKRRVWPHLETGEYVYSVKHLSSRELKFVVARNMKEAEYKAWPEVVHEQLRSMPVHAWDSGSLRNPVDPNKRL